MTRYSDYQFKKHVKQAIERLGFTEPTPIQKEMIPLILQRKSAIGQAHTGTGKSHSFLIPILDRLDVEQPHLQAVITTPTRELAMQLHTEFKKMSAETNIRSALLIGGTDKQRSIEKLKTPPHIVFGTPGRLRDLTEEGALSVHTASILVIDEADLAFDMGFIEDIDHFAAKMPDTLEMYVFSATIPEKLKPFLAKYMEKPVHIQIGKQKSLTEGIHYALVPVKSMEKERKLLQVMQTMQPYLCIIFTNTKQRADELADYLLENGYQVGRIHGDLSPRERTRMMKQIRELAFQYIVATDLAARGIDIPGVSHVINFDLPDELEYFIHRVGRTARAGLEGTAITLYMPADEDKVARIEQLGIPFVHQDVKNGDWVTIKARHARKKRVKEMDELDLKAKRFIQKPKKIKPGYKKKMASEIDRFKKRERRLKRKK